MFHDVVKREPREVWLSSEERAVSERGPVMTAAEKAALNGHDVVPQDEAAAATHEHPPVEVVEVPPNHTPDTPGPTDTTGRL